MHNSNVYQSELFRSFLFSNVQLLHVHNIIPACPFIWVHWATEAAAGVVVAIKFLPTRCSVGENDDNGRPVAARFKCNDEEEDDVSAGVEVELVALVVNDDFDLPPVESAALGLKKVSMLPLAGGALF